MLCHSKLAHIWFYYKYYKRAYKYTVRHRYEQGIHATVMPQKGIFRNPRLIRVSSTDLTMMIVPMSIDILFNWAMKSEATAS